MANVFADDDGDSTGAAAGGDPVAPADDKAREVANSSAGKIVLAAAFGDSGAELRKLKGADECVEGTDKPHAKKQPRVGETRGDIAGSANDAGGNGVANGDSDAETDAENLEQRALFLARMRGTQRQVSR